MPSSVASIQNRTAFTTNWTLSFPIHYVNGIRLFNSLGKFHVHSLALFHKCAVKGQFFLFSPVFFNHMESEKPILENYTHCLILEHDTPRNRSSINFPENDISAEHGNASVPTVCLIWAPHADRLVEFYVRWKLIDISQGLIVPSSWSEIKLRKNLTWIRQQTQPCQPTMRYIPEEAAPLK
jgi:hypothetical protein